MKTKTAKKPVVTDTAPIAVPAAVRPGTAQPATAANMLASLAAKAKPAATKDKQDRPVLDLTPEVQAHVAELAEVKEVFDIIEARLKAVKGQVNPELFSAWLDLAWALKNQPASPRIAINRGGKPDIDALFIVQEKWSLQAAAADQLKSMLTETAGLSSDNADKIISEVSYAPFVGIRDFQEMSVGKRTKEGDIAATPAEQALANKLMALITSDNFTDEERALMLYTKPNSQVKKDFLKRVVNYCQTKEQLAKVLAIFKPVAYAKGAKIGASDSPAVKVDRLADTARKLIGAGAGKVEKDED